MWQAVHYKPPIYSPDAWFDSIRRLLEQSFGRLWISPASNSEWLRFHRSFCQSPQLINSSCQQRQLDFLTSNDISEV